MRESSAELNKYRVRSGRMASSDKHGMAGSFIFPTPNPQRKLFVLSSGPTEDWEHVSVHTKEKKNKNWKIKTPTWDEMCIIKKLFWLPGEAVVQYHPAAIDYVNMHDHVLHLWRSVKEKFPKPDLKYV